MVKGEILQEWNNLMSDDANYSSVQHHDNSVHSVDPGPGNHLPKIPLSKLYPVSLASEMFIAQRSVRKMSRCPRLCANLLDPWASLLDSWASLPDTWASFSDPWACLLDLWASLPEYTQVF